MNNVLIYQVGSLHLEYLESIKKNINRPDIFYASTAGSIKSIQNKLARRPLLSPYNLLIVQSPEPKSEVAQELLKVDDKTCRKIVISSNRKFMDMLPGFSVWNSYRLNDEYLLDVIEKRTVISDPKILNKIMWKIREDATNFDDIITVCKYSPDNIDKALRTIPKKCKIYYTNLLHSIFLGEMTEDIYYYVRKFRLAYKWIHETITKELEYLIENHVKWISGKVSRGTDRRLNMAIDIFEKKSLEYLLAVYKRFSDIRPNYRNIQMLLWTLVAENGGL